MKRVQKNPAGGGKTARTKDDDQSHQACEISGLSKKGMLPESKVIEDALAFDSVRDRRSLMRYSGERTEVVTHGPDGHKRRVTTRHTLQFLFHDWRVGIAIAGTIVAILVLWLLFNKPAP